MSLNAGVSLITDYIRSFEVEFDKVLASDLSKLNISTQSHFIYYYYMIIPLQQVKHKDPYYLKLGPGFELKQSHPCKLRN